MIDTVTNTVIALFFSKQYKTVLKMRKIKNPTKGYFMGFHYIWRGLRDLNSRAGFPTYSLSRAWIKHVL